MSREQQENARLRREAAQPSFPVQVQPAPASLPVNHTLIDEHENLNKAHLSLKDEHRRLEEELHNMRADLKAQIDLVTQRSNQLQDSQRQLREAQSAQLASDQ